MMRKIVFSVTFYRRLDSCNLGRAFQVETVEQDNVSIFCYHFHKLHVNSVGSSSVSFNNAIVDLFLFRNLHQVRAIYGDIDITL